MKTIHCIHGFLGLPSDWDFMVEAFPDYKIQAWDIWGNLKKIKSLDLYELSINLWEEYIPTIKPGDLFLGYSLGGRVLMHLQDQIDYAILVSSNPGIKNEKDKFQRLRDDHQWAFEFEKLPWHQVLDRWNSQKIFDQSIVHERQEKDFDRLLLSHALTHFSHGVQSYQTIPHNWPLIVGENDKKYLEMAKGLNLESLFVIPNSYHRVPWEKQNEFVGLLKDIICQHHS